MATELAVAYLSVVPETSRIAPGVKAALRGVDADAARAGKSMGGKLSSALGTALKAGAATAGAAAIAGIGVTLTKGFQRLSAIDEARAKLTALGSSGREVDAIMKNALDSVRGTSFGLGDAAGLAGTMVAAGIKPGRELESVLRTVADSAAVAGTDLNDMGAIFGKVAAKGKLDGEALNQLMERQIGILPELAKHYGVTTEEASKMVSEGKVKFDDFAKVMQEKLGGGALKMGNTVKGAFANMNAAIGRLGASALEPFFQKLPGGFNGIGNAIDALEPKVKALSSAFAEKVFDDWAPKVREAMQAFKDSGNLERARDVFEKLFSAMGDNAPLLGRIATELGRASAALGVSGWQLFLTALEASATTLQIINPLLSGMASLMENNRGLVVAFMAAWVGLKTIPNLIGGARTALMPLAAGIQSARANVAGFTDAYRQSMVWVRQSNPGISTASAHFKVLQGNVKSAGGAMGVMRGIGGGLMGALGGPWGIALAGAGIGLAAFANHQQKAAQKAAQHKADIDALTDSINAYTGALNEAGKKEVNKQLEDAGAFEQGKKLGVHPSTVQKAGEGDPQANAAAKQAGTDAVRSAVEGSKAWEQYSETLSRAGVSLDDVTAAMLGNQLQQNRMNRALNGSLGAKAAFSSATQQAVKDAKALNGTLDDQNGKLDGARDKLKQQDEALGGVAKRLGSLAEQFKGQGKGFSLDLDTTELAGTEKALERIGFKLQDLGDGKVKVTAETEQATKNLQLLATAAKNIPAGKSIKVDSPGGQAVYDLLRSMGVEVTKNNDKTISTSIPEGHPVLALLQSIGYEVETRNGKTILVKADDDDYQNKKTDWTQTEYKKIMVEAVQSGAQFGSPLPSGHTLYGPGLSPGRADGAIVRSYLNGGIAAAEAYANGGLKVIEKPMRADIFAGRGAGTIFAEKETGGEAYVPLAPGKRKRSTDILATVADMFGLALVPKESISGTLGDAVGNVVTRALKSSVGRGITRFADGGITAAQLKDHMRGIDDARYVWGGWGQGYNTDCSGGQSIGVNATEGNMQAGTGERSATGGYPSWLPKMDYQIGRAPAGVPAHEIGWSSEHASGTIFDPAGGDVNFEMGGQNGGGAFGRGAVSSRDGQFPNQAWKRLADAVTAAAPNAADPQTEPDATTTSPSSVSQPDQSPTLSGRLGGAAGAFVSGQLQSLFGVLGINDSPGALAALSEYERQRQQKQGDPSTREAIEKGADPKKLQAAENKIADKEGQLRAAEQRLREVEADPKAKESAKLTARARVEKLERELDQARKDLEALKRQQKSTPVTPLPEGDPGVPAGDVKSIVRRALQSRGWHEGDQWSATDWIANKESTWNPKARNGKYTGLFQLGPDAWKAAGIDPTDDPAKQAEAYAHYVEGRYKLPTAAKAFHEQNNWYDQGGIAPHKGVLLKNINQPERVLSPRQTQSFEEMVRRDFQSGIGTDQVIAELRVIRELLADRDGGDIHNHFPDYGSAKRDAEEVSRDQRQRALLGGL